MQPIVGRLARVVPTAALGSVLGFVTAATLFADGTWEERRVMIAVILLGYGLAGAALGFRASPWYGLGLALPGAAVSAALSAAGEGAWWYVLFWTLIVALATGAATINAIRIRGRTTA